LGHLRRQAVFEIRFKDRKLSQELRRQIHRHQPTGNTNLKLFHFRLMLFILLLHF
jgi:hypothetical protein